MKDYIKYNVEGLGGNLNKRQLVFTIVKDWIEKTNPTLEELQKVFPDETHGGNPDKFGLIRKEGDIINHRYFNMREPLKIKHGINVVVMNQWGDNIDNFIKISRELGYVIHPENNHVGSSNSAQNSTTPEPSLTLWQKIKKFTKKMTNNNL